MNIYLNNTPQEIQASSTITNVLGSLNIPAQKGVAIAVNNNVIPRAEWEAHILMAEDKVTLIKATQGG